MLDRLKSLPPELPIHRLVASPHQLAGDVKTLPLYWEDPAHAALDRPRRSQAPITQRISPTSSATQLVADCIDNRKQEFAAVYCKMTEEERADLLKRKMAIKL